MMKPSKTQLEALKANGFSLEDVAAAVTHKDYHFTKTGKNTGMHVTETAVAPGQVEFGMVKEFLKAQGIEVNGRTWTRIEHDGDEVIDRY